VHIPVVAPLFFQLFDKDYALTLLGLKHADSSDPGSRSPSPKKQKSAAPPSSDDSKGKLVCWRPEALDAYAFLAFIVFRIVLAKACLLFGITPSNSILNLPGLPLLVVVCWSAAHVKGMECTGEARE
jgi:hypothetical protein